MSCKCESCALSHLNFADESEFGDSIEVEVAKPDNRPRRYIISVFGRGDEHGNEMFITEDLNRIKALRDALTKIVEQGESNVQA